MQTNQECPTIEKSTSQYKRYWAYYQHLLQKVQKNCMLVPCMHELRNEWSYWHFALHYFDVSMFVSLAQSLTWAAPPHKQQYSMWRRRLKCFHEEVNTAAFLNTVYRCTWSNSTWGLFSSPLFTKLFISLFRSVFMSVFLCETTQAAFFSPAVNCLHPPLLLYSVAHMIHKNKDGVCPFWFLFCRFFVFRQMSRCPILSDAVLNCGWLIL